MADYQSKNTGQQPRNIKLGVWQEAAAIERPYHQVQRQLLHRDTRDGAWRALPRAFTTLWSISETTGESQTRAIRRRQSEDDNSVAPKEPQAHDVGRRCSWEAPRLASIWAGRPADWRASARSNDPRQGGWRDLQGTSQGNLPPGGTFAGTSEAQAARPPARPGGLPVHPLTAARRQRQKADGRRQETRWQALAESAAVAPPSELREDSPLTGCGNHAREGRLCKQLEMVWRNE